MALVSIYFDHRSKLISLILFGESSKFVQKRFFFVEKIFCAAAALCSGFQRKAAVLLYCTTFIIYKKCTLEQRSLTLFLIKFFASLSIIAAAQTAERERERERERDEAGEASHKILIVSKIINKSKNITCTNPKKAENSP